jgi:AcrR family transcriptional regulator
MAAVVRVTAAKGFEAMSVADILEQAGVGRQSFYELFSGKLDCLLAAHDLLIDDLAATTAVAFEGPQPLPARVRTALAAVLDWFASNPEAARVTMVESAMVGPLARDRFRVGLHRFTILLDEGLEEPGAAAELPELLPELTFELLVPFVGEEAAREAARGGAT